MLAVSVMTAVLFIFPLVKASLGMDLADTGYSLGNYLYPEKLQDMWYCSTYLANLTGSLLMKLPGGDTLIGMRLYTGLLVSAMALISFFFCIRCFPGPGRSVRSSHASGRPCSEDALNPECQNSGTASLPRRPAPRIFEYFLIFLGELIAIGLCWCPTVILYNYLTYFFLIIAQILLYTGLTKNNRVLLFFAGGCLGCNIMVRLPNVLEAVFILCVIAWEVWSGGESASESASNPNPSKNIVPAVVAAEAASITDPGAAVSAQKTARAGVLSRILADAIPCILGCFAAYLVLLISILLTRGPAAYLNMLTGLFSVSKTAEGYSLLDMAGAFFGVFITEFYYLKYLAILLAAGGICAVTLFWVNGKQDSKAVPGTDPSAENTEFLTENLKGSVDSAETTERIIVMSTKCAHHVKWFLLIYSAASAALFAFLCTRNLFHFSYGDTGAFYNLAALFILLALVLSAVRIIHAAPENCAPIQFDSPPSSAGAAHTNHAAEQSADLSSSAGAAANAGADSAAHRLMALIILLTILVLPFGSNNNIYPVINCLFIIAPWTLTQLYSMAAGCLAGGLPSGKTVFLSADRKESFEMGDVGRYRTLTRFLRLPPAAVLSCLILVQALGTGTSYVFGDAPRSELTGVFPEDPALGCVTTPERARLLEDLYQTAYRWRELTPARTAADELMGSRSGSGEAVAAQTAASQPTAATQATTASQPTAASQPAEILIYGDLPGLSYYLQLPPAISSTWPNLESYPAAEFTAQLEKLKAENRKPFVVVAHCEEQNEEKEKALTAFLEELNYSQTMASGAEGGVKVYEAFR